MRSTTAAALVAALLLQTAARTHAQQLLRWSVAEGQPLVDASVRFGLSNEDVAFPIPASTILSLANSSFARANDSQAVGGKAYADGTLTIQGAVPINTSSYELVSSSVLDTGMRAALVPVGTKLQLVDVGLINLCFVDWPLFGNRLATPFLMNIFSLNSAVASLHINRTVLYMPRATLAFSLMTVLWFQMPPEWTTVRDRYSHQFGALGWTGRSTVRFSTAYEMNMLSTLLPSFDGSGTQRSLDHPTDPLLQYMRSNGLLMAPRWCSNGTLVPDRIANAVIDPVWGPVWMADTQDQAIAYLINATALAPVQQAAGRPVPVVVLYLSSLSTALVSMQGLEAPLVLCGPINLDPTSLIPVLDLSNRTSSLFNVTTPSGQLYLQRLALTLPAWPTTSSTNSTTTALSLAAVAVAGPTTANSNDSATAPRMGALVELNNVTLVVPVLDFMALMTLATDKSSSGSMRACMDAATLQHATRLAPSIRALSADATTWDVLTLSAYSAWGVNASALLVRPQTPVPTSITQRCTFPPPAPLASSSSALGSDGATSAQTVGIIVGCTVGGVALVAAAAAAVLLVRRKRRKERTYALSGGHDSSSVDLDGGKQAQAAPAAATACDAATRTTHANVSQSLTTAPSNLTYDANHPGSKLLALLQSQERHLMQQGQAGTARAAEGAARSGSGDAAGGGSAATLGQAHQQLMQSVVGSRQREPAVPSVVRSTASSASHQSDHRQAVQQLATRLQGDDVDAVTLTRVLGRGGGGTVYQGVWRGMPVAVKTMVFEAWEGDEGVAGGDKTRMRYMRAVMETALSASLGHLNVVATYHYDIKRMDDSTSSAADGLQVAMADQALDQAQPSSPATPSVKTFKVFLVQELCTCSLRMAMEHGALDNEDVSTSLSLLHQVACGLEYLHGQGVIHGDLTPGNILLKCDNDQSNVVVKLADFGLSNRLDGQATHVSGFGGGTPFYVAPEVVHYKRTSPASDIFTFGIIVWEVLTQSQPFVTAPDGALKRNPLFPTFPAGAGPPPEVDKLMHRCLSSQPHKRPPIAEVLAVLDRHIVWARGHAQQQQ